MTVCAGWLCADFLLRQGFAISTTPEGNCIAERDDLSFPIAPMCNHADCPPHPVKILAGA